RFGRRDSHFEIAEPQKSARDHKTLPPLTWHSASLAVSIQPSPLHEFWPLQEERAVLQALVPLQELTPLHFTAPSPAETRPARPSANTVAAVAARNADLVISRLLGDQTRIAGKP